MSRVELLSSGGLRLDNRRPYELRSIDFNILPNPPVGCDSVARVEHGLTKLIGFVSGPRDSVESNRTVATTLGNPTSNSASSNLNNNNNNQNGSISVHISTTPFSSIDRKKIGRSDKKFADLAQAIQNTFEPVVMLHLYPRSTIDIYVQVLQQDGALLQAAINVTTLALIGAGVSISDYVLSVSVGALSTPSCPLLDLTNSEQTDLPNLTIAVLPRTQKLTLLQLDTRINILTFESLLEIGLEACLVLQLEMDREVRRWATLLNSSIHNSLDYKSHSAQGPVADQNPQIMMID
ncbi:Exosome non-catalytic core component [Puccinia graminis f. sp. tritici]|uniref:Ribosomal RNA-processing protein 41 n=2 Tax=Puccinia graminis f. sp. tritici TaxID=56615 RepID=E3JRH4_PUCGT|nr:uncharacterized protein PGTG_00403 [Puccinia graminis f. sp. tritici CRL 75-36-700-3]EFP74447.2 hypothetical protein PGTG_00403 [Puccinia graminis f. sp. tritici CRL 75-36-700-3]KAA1106163.1 Exosome non-catalytic core component [Puccinia graminis f. sp. tritici]KAA1109215.1 Exosome non-catalytic core component [Puccinia graminis f. sp. tritici]KAA1127288.1 Exosome non-catalytic core component [Puccinia graminis f. sp. tritici]